MQFPRAAGILLHPTSLPSRGGIGDFGPAAYRFVDALASARQGLWQGLPLGPLGYGNSPYSFLSAFARNPAADQRGTSRESRLDRFGETFLSCFRNRCGRIRSRLRRQDAAVV